VTTTLADAVRYPTPQAADGSDVETGFGLRDYVNHKRKYMLPTPTVSDAPDGGGPPNKNANTTMWDGVNSLGQMAKQGYWPTPTKNANTDCPSERERHTPSLESAVKLATPQSRDYRIGGRDRYDNPDRSNNLNDQVGGKLSAAWVEWLMGLPEGWVSPKSDDGNMPSRMGKWFDLASHGMWWDEERGLPRVVETQDDRVSKLKTLGNGIVPMCIPIFLRVANPLP